MTKSLLLIIVMAAGVFGLLSDAAGQTKLNNEKLEKATFAGGCFWCMEHPFEELKGIKSVISGYTGGTMENPTYQDVTSGKSGHFEVVQITYDPGLIDYSTLLKKFWKQVDPTDPYGQFVDKGSQYKTAIFYHNDEQKQLAESSKAELEKSGRFKRPVVTEILAASKFYAAEDYHQDFYKKSPGRYQSYRAGSGRDKYLINIWGDELEDGPEETGDESKDVQMGEKGNGYRAFKRPSDLELKATLTALQYRVIREDGTERPYSNKYWDNKKKGIYVDVISGEPLFSSIDKYVSGTGWPSFVRPLEPENVMEIQDNSLFMRRTEVRSKYADSHLGHLFEDGPEPTGLRYCLNSAALRFIAKEALVKEGYGEYLKLF